MSYGCSLRTGRGREQGAVGGGSFQLNGDKMALALQRQAARLGAEKCARTAGEFPGPWPTEGVRVKWHLHLGVW